ncbi:MAG: 4-hydroxy-3-methylbut-2-enyl diphosphate reductase [Bacteroidota bacterium]|nr:4-hydroxy-3-methylbut-2-enyl diphosphate reductase [Bacteroidota bacterium]
MKITIDKNSGFCFGVVYAVEHAEKELKKNEPLYCLGDIVHNSLEVQRLENMGMITVSHKEYKELKDVKVLIRAHGEPPETYEIAKRNNIKLVDASCPVVLRLQNKVKRGTEASEEEDGQLVIYGKKNHAEVIGLLGQTAGKGIVITTEDDLEKIDFTRPIKVYSQTTMSTSGYASITSEIKRRMEDAGNDSQLAFQRNNTICRQVSGRDKVLKAFAANNDVIIFVSGKKSSNGKVLYDVCKAENKQTNFISNLDQLTPDMVQGAETVGICGATSTPMWLMEKVRDKLDTF